MKISLHKGKSTLKIISPHGFHFSYQAYTYKKNTKYNNFKNQQTFTDVYIRTLEGNERKLHKVQFLPPQILTKFKPHSTPITLKLVEIHLSTYPAIINDHISTCNCKVSFKHFKSIPNIYSLYMHCTSKTVT